jgi:hypothetical protein
MALGPEAGRSRRDDRTLVDSVVARRAGVVRRPLDLLPTSAVALALATALFTSLAGTACRDRSDVAREARRVFERASPPGSSCLAGEPRRVTERFEASCRLSLSAEWDEYKQWLRAALAPYQERAETVESITFSTTTDGDVYTVRAELVDNAPAKVVRLLFTAAPW